VRGFNIYNACCQAGYGKGRTEKGKQSAAQNKRRRTTRQATQTQPLLLPADAFAADLGTVPSEDCPDFVGWKEIILRRTSKRVKEVVDKMCLSVVVCLSRSSWDDTRNGTAAEKLLFVIRQLPLMTAWCRISTLELPSCDIKGQDVERLAGVLAEACRSAGAVPGAGAPQS
jgi:hypothetical protein